VTTPHPTTARTKIPLTTLEHNSLKYKRGCFHPAHLLVQSASKRAFIGP
jgi:hypothetical protein